VAAPALRRGRPGAWALALAALLLAACASRPVATPASAPRDRDGPPEHVPPGLADQPDAVPRIEPINPYANRPYTALGHRYEPDTGDAPFEQRGMASWYGREYHGNRTASGETYDMFGMTAAHPTLPIPSYARVTNTRDGRSVVVRINDRGPFILDRVIDLSYGAAVRLGIANPGSGEVVVHKLTTREIAAWPAATPAVAQAPAPAVASASDAAPAIVVQAAKVMQAPEPPAAAPLPALADAAGTADAAAPLEPASPGVAAEPAPTPAPERTTRAEGATGATAAAPAGNPAPSATTARATDPPVAAARGNGPPARTGAAAGGPTWSVQLGAFAVAEHANTLRDALARRLASAAADGLPAEARTVRVEQTGRLSRVLVGRLFDRANAQALASQLGRLLGQETSLFTR
jgi:rare lipoprotein A